MKFDHDQQDINDAIGMDASATLDKARDLATGMGNNHQTSISRMTEVYLNGMTKEELALIAAVMTQEAVGNRMEEREDKEESHMMALDKRDLSPELQAVLDSKLTDG